MAEPTHYRPLSPREQALLDLLLAENFPGAKELRVQAQSVRGRLWNGLASLVELDVSEPRAPRANVTERVPVEAEMSDTEAPQALLLHVVDGMLNCLELVVYDLEETAELPEPSAFARP
jgi:hypothetical protein